VFRLQERGLACSSPAGSQLQDAVDFLTAHPGQVAFVTIDVGVNDLTAPGAPAAIVSHRSVAQSDAAQTPTLEVTGDLAVPGA